MVLLKEIKKKKSEKRKKLESTQGWENNIEGQKKT